MVSPPGRSRRLGAGGRSVEEGRDSNQTVYEQNPTFFSKFVFFHRDGAAKGRHLPPFGGCPPQRRRCLAPTVVVGGGLQRRRQVVNSS